MNLWAPGMFLFVLMMIFTGYPVAFALGGTALIVAGVASLFGNFDLVLLYALPESPIIDALVASSRCLGDQ